MINQCTVNWPIIELSKIIFLLLYPFSQGILMLSLTADKNGAKCFLDTTYEHGPETILSALHILWLPNEVIMQFLYSQRLTIFSKQYSRFAHDWVWRLRDRVHSSPVFYQFLSYDIESELTGRKFNCKQPNVCFSFVPLTWNGILTALRYSELDWSFFPDAANQWIPNIARL